MSSSGHASSAQPADTTQGGKLSITCHRKIGTHNHPTYSDWSLGGRQMSDTAAWIAITAALYGDANAPAFLRLAGLLPTVDKYYVDSNGQKWPMSGKSHTLASGISRTFSQVAQGISQALDHVQTTPLSALTQRALAIYGLALAQSALTFTNAGGTVSHPGLQASDGSELCSTVRNATWMMPPTENLYAPQADAGCTEYWTSDDLDILRSQVKQLCSSIMQYSQTIHGRPATYLPEAGGLSDAYGTPLLVDGSLHNDCERLYTMAEELHEGQVAEDRQAAKASNERDKQREREATKPRFVRITVSGRQ